MLAHLLPNSEIEVTFDLREVTQRRDRPVPRTRLDIRFPVTTKTRNRLESRAVAGFGRLHRGKSSPRRGTKRRVQRLGGLIDSLSESTGLERIFITLTCPGSSKEAIEGFSAWTGYILKSLNDWLSMKQRRSSGDKDFFRLHVWELQKRGAEHVHYVCLLSSSVVSVVRQEIREWYSSLLNRVSRLSGVDIFERGDGGGSWRNRPDVLQLKVEKVKRSVSAYLSKYLGKALGQSRQGFTARLTPRPARLWGASRCLKRAMRSCSTSRYFHVDKEEVAPSLCAIVALLEKKQKQFSFQQSRSGLMGRLRCFFGGDKQSQKQAWDEVCRVMSESESVTTSEGRRIPDMGRLYKKGIRIRDNNKKKVAFVDLYGADIYKSVLSWLTENPVEKFYLSLAVDCLEDFDEITLLSKRSIAPAKNPKTRTVLQLELLLYPKTP